VRVRLGGIVCEFGVSRRPAGFEEGWAVLRPLSHRDAEVVRPAPLASVKEYLALLPRARLIATTLLSTTWLGLFAAAPAKGIRVEGLVPIVLAPRLRLFETAVVRFDGAAFLFESAERAPMAAWLREQLDLGTTDLHRSGRAAAERAAFGVQRRVREEAAKSADQRRLESALNLADAELIRYEARADQFTVTYRVDGRTFTSLVQRGDLTVLSAGICLDGTDRLFDLTTLATVMRESGERGEDD